MHITGTSTQAERARALRTFTASHSHVEVFLLSMRSAAVGLTLVAASRLFLMEPSLNLAHEAQAFGRVHRYGQTKPVVVTRYVLNGTVEPRIRTMHERDARRSHARLREQGRITGFLERLTPAEGAASSSNASNEVDQTPQQQQALDLPTLKRLLAPADEHEHDAAQGVEMEVEAAGV